ncbi:MAG: hypothetical protein IJW12_02815 [Opitutales bacterium]|nr:hypothetical protein [Opitutales bacterium]
MKNKILIGTSLLLAFAGNVQAETIWVKSGSLQKYLYSGAAMTKGLDGFSGESRINYSINFNEDAKYVIGYGIRYGGSSNQKNISNVMFAFSGKDYSLVVGKSRENRLCVGEINGGFFSSDTSTPYTFSDAMYTKIPEMTVLDSAWQTSGSFTYEISLETSSSGPDKISVYIPELNKTSTYELKSGNDAAMSLIGFQMYGSNYSSKIEPAEAAVLESWVAVQKYVKYSPEPEPRLPEPSAFGLLAGTFALALAASRRARRKGK